MRNKDQRPEKAFARGSWVDRTRRWMRWPLWVIVCGLPIAGCTHASAKTAPDSPPLQVPPPPPRDVEVVDVAMPEPLPLPEEPARSAAPIDARPQPRAQQPRPVPPPVPAVEPPKTESEPPKPVEEAPKPTLQTTPAANEGEVEKSIRALIARANVDLKRIDVRALNAEARTQYDIAARFVLQAEDALIKRNLVFARTVADKAAVLAAQLAGK